MSQLVSEIVSCENRIHQFFLNWKIGSLLKRSNIDKEKGISPVCVFRVLVTLVFTGKNLSPPSKQVEAAAWPRTRCIGFSTRSITNWRRFLLLLSSRCGRGNSLRSSCC
jgi:hypothetical protein